MTELPDIRPLNGGEYFYHHGNGSVYSRSDNSQCLACGARTDYCQRSRFNAIAQCEAAARRIAAMLPQNACEKAHQTGFGGIWVTVWACDEHVHNLDLLRELTSDGIITLERVFTAVRAAIGRGKFNELVAQEARSIWASKTDNRSHYNWCDAWELCVKELGRIPSPAERRARAERLHEERKWEQASEDWLEAERRITEKYTIAD